MDLEKLQKLHAQLRKAKYFYYEKSESIMTDYEFDMMEKEYEKLADKFNIDKELRVTQYIGFGIQIPMNILFHKKE